MADFAIPSPWAWDDSFDVGNTLFNDQHKKLFELIGTLGDDMSNADVLKELLDYVVLHFKSEEDAFEQLGYAGADAHKQIHDKFVSDALAVSEVTSDVIDFLKGWLVKHIKGSDMKYKDQLSAYSE